MCSLVLSKQMLYNNSNLTLRKANSFLKSGKGGRTMTIGDAILVLVDKLLSEKEKTVKLELEKEQLKKQDEQTDEG